MKKRIILISAFLLIIDIIIKMVVENNIMLDENIVVIKNFFQITKVYNDGASWNILAGHPLIIIAITIVALIALLIYQCKFQKNWRNIIAFGFLYGGILGNLIDRTLYGYVIDYLSFKIFGYNYPVFNFADICIVLGVLLLLVAVIKKEDVCDDSSR